MTRITLFIALQFLFLSNIQSQDKSTLEIMGVSELSVKPSLAVISLNIRTVKIDYSGAIDDLTQRIDLLTKSLVKKGIDKAEIVTSNFNINRNTVYQRGTRKDSGYVATQSLKVQFIYSKSKFLNVLNSVTQSSADADLSIAFDLTKEQKLKVRDELIALAVRDAQKKAALIASTANYRLDGIKKISYGVNMNRSPQMNRAFAAESTTLRSNTNISNFEAQDLSLSDQVYITFSITANN